MTDRHPFFDGRRVTTIPLLAAGAYALAYVFWYGTIDGGRCGIGIVELVAFAFALVSTWLLSPAMATWEATGTAKLRHLSASAHMAVIAVAMATPIVVYLAVTRLPTSVVPGSDQYDFGALGITAWLPAVTNLAVLAGIASTAVALTGRLAGTITTLAAYPALFWLGANTNTPSPYTSFCSTDTNPPAWIAAGTFIAAAAAVLIATGGTTVLSRRLDPRHSG